MTSPIPAARLLLFDVFGTVVDWRSSIAREVMDVPKARGVKIDAQAFADRWRAGYRPAMDRVRKGELPWTNIDTLHRMVLDAMLPEFGLDGLSEAQRDYFNRAWHRLDPWPDSVAGLTRLKSGFVIGST